MSQPAARPNRTAVRSSTRAAAVVLLGRTFEEYVRYFDVRLDDLRGKAILDVASGVSSFCAEACGQDFDVTAFDVIYDLDVDEIQTRCKPDLDSIVEAIRNLSVYRWQFYKSPEDMRGYREKAYKRFLTDYREQRGKRYISGKLPRLPFRDKQFSLALVSYLLFVYEDQLNYEFHKESILEIMRVTSGEARIYPIVTFEGRRSTYVERFTEDPDLNQLRFEERMTDFEFLQNSNHVLIIRHKNRN